MLSDVVELGFFFKKKYFLAICWSKSVFMKTTCSPSNDLQNVKNSPEPPTTGMSPKMGFKPTILIRDEKIQSHDAPKKQMNDGNYIIQTWSFSLFKTNEKRWKRCGSHRYKSAGHGRAGCLCGWRAELRVYDIRLHVSRTRVIVCCFVGVSGTLNAVTPFDQERLSALITLPIGKCDRTTPRHNLDQSSSGVW